MKSKDSKISKIVRMLMMLFNSDPDRPVFDDHDSGQ